MYAVPDRQTEHRLEIIDFVAFRGAVPRREATAAGNSSAPADAVIVAFPSERMRQQPDTLPEGRAVQAASELSIACTLLVESFRAMHEAVAELQESCRVLDDNAGEIQDQAGTVLIGIAALSTITERFQSQLDATIDAAFR